MKPTLQVHIAQPCHENWEAMLPDEKGRFCQSCNKQVIDFTHMTDQQLLHYFTHAKGPTCGRFAQDQLQRDLTPGTVSRKKSRWLALFMPLLVLFDRADAQNRSSTKGKAAVTVAPDKKVKGDTVIVVGGAWPVRRCPPIEIATAQRILQGIVTDTNGEPLPYAAVWIKELAKTVETDTAGRYRVALNIPENRYTLTVSLVGYAPLTQIITWKNDKTDTIRLQPLVPKLPDVKVVTHGTQARSYSHSRHLECRHLLHPHNRR